MSRRETTASHTPPPTWLTPAEVAKHFRVRLRTIRRLLKSGEIPALRLGGQYRIHRRTLDELERSVPTRPKSDPFIHEPSIDLVGHLSDVDQACAGASADDVNAVRSSAP